MAIAPQRTAIGIRRHFTTEGVHPYEEVAWERRDSRITDYRDGSVAFEQLDVEVPTTWSLNATNILAQKYFRGTPGTEERENSLRQVIDRVVDTVTEWGLKDGYFEDPEEARAFSDELKHVIVHQKAAFNSPVWFNIGVKGVPQQASACQPYDALVNTPGGFVPIGRLVEQNAVGEKVLDAHGITRIVAVKHNGQRPVLRIHTKAGHALDVTADHLVWKASDAVYGRFVPAGDLRPGDQLEWCRNESFGEREIRSQDIAESALAGWLQSDGFVGQYAEGTNRSLTIEAMSVTDAELAWVTSALDAVFPDVHRHERTVVTQDKTLDCRRTRLYGAALAPFVEKWDLLRRGTDMTVPEELFTAPLPVVRAYLRSIFQAEGYVTIRETGAAVSFDMISEGIVRGAQALLARFGIFSRVGFKADKRPDRKGCWSLSIRTLGDRIAFSEEIGFIDRVKADKLESSLRHADGLFHHPTKRLEIDRIETIGEMDVYDIQTESGEYLSDNLRVHNCFILAVDDSMSSILNWYREEGTIFKGGSGAGVNLSRIRASVENLNGGGTASGPVSFMRGADASAGTIKSGGKTRRAAKMVILDVDHPDIEDFIWCKALEEKKARVLRDAGFNMDLDGSDAFSIQYQNANNSVRVTDEFMQAVMDDADWDLIGRMDRTPVRTVRARDLYRQLAKATWECADPGMQFDTTINRWHTAPNAGRINGSNPCFPGSALVHTDKGLIRFSELFDRANRGEAFGVYTHDATSPDTPAQRVELTSPEAFMITGFNDIVRLRFDNGMELRCTPGHKLFTANRGFVEAQELTTDDDVKVLDVPAPAVSADLGLPVSSDPDTYRPKGDHGEFLRLPDQWTPEFGHYLGWLIGDGSTSGSTTSTIYGSAEDRIEILPGHAALVEWINGDRPLKISEQANGTAQLRLNRRPFKGFLEALGVRSVRGPEKSVPWSIEQAPAPAVASFLQGLFDADGCVVVNRDQGSYVGLGSASPGLLRGVQTLLATFGVYSRVEKTRSSSDKSSYDLRITSGSIVGFAQHIGFSLSRKQALLREASLDGPKGFYDVRRTARLVERTDDGVELTYNLSEPRNHSYIVDGIVVRNCSEYMHLDNSACNLASINLLKYLREDGSFDTDGFTATVEVVFTAQEILVGNADYPTEPIAENSRRYRQLGLGYANIGALLMAQGLPYDSNEGRAWAASITALMTGHAYATSARTAARMGPFAGYHSDSEAMQNVLRMHRAEVAKIDEDLVPPELLSAAQEAWDNAVELGERHGVRNSQASVLAPTGTIGLLMDCDTTGVEPDLGLVKTKKLVGGGTMSIVNQTIPRALVRLGYAPEQVEDIVSYINENMSIIGAPHIAPEHLPVFACSMGDNTIHYLGHVRMMGAVQPFISGALSKCVVGETLLATADGLFRIGSLHQGEESDSFRHEIMAVASLDGIHKTDAFYYGGVRPVHKVVLRSGHTVTGTPNHRVLVAGDGGLDWKRLDEIDPGDYVATKYGDDLWSTLPTRFDDFVPTPLYGSQKAIDIPQEMSIPLALFLGAYASEGHTSRSVWTVIITNSDEGVLEDVVTWVRMAFGIEAKIRRPADRCPSVEISSKTLVEFLDYLGCGDRASAKRIPDAILRSPRKMVTTFLQGLALDAYTSSSRGAAKWGICLDAPRLLDDLQSILTNLGIVHGRVTKHNPLNGKDYDEVYVTGPHARELVEMVPFLEAEKRVRSLLLPVPDGRGNNAADVVPGISPAELYSLVPYRQHNAAGVLLRTEFNFLADPRTQNVSRTTVERIAAIPGFVLPPWLQTVLDDNLHFSPVQSVGEAGTREVYDISVPVTHAFVGNGIVNHNTVNLPEDVTVEDVEQLHIDAWQMGIKAIAIYRDNCKVGQPLSTTKVDQAEGGDNAPPGSEAEARDRAATARIAELELALLHEQGRPQDTVLVGAVRERLPRRRASSTFAFRVADCEGYVTVGEYEDGRPGEVFMKVSKQGSTLAGIMDAFSISVSLGLQHGVPLATYVRKYTSMRFEPAGITDDPDLRIATSLVDYIFRRLAVDYLSREEREELGVLSTAERMQPTLPGVEEAATPVQDLMQDGGISPAPAQNRDTRSARPAQAAPSSGEPSLIQRAQQRDAPICYQCGMVMQRAGSCYLCSSCGTTSGCS
jgi:ribonucleotide reductase alpha subunit